MQTQSDKKNNNDDNAPKHNNNTVSFAAQMKTIFNEWVDHVWLYSSQLMTTMWLQYALLEAIYTPILWPNIINLLIIITLIFNIIFEHVGGELYNHNHAIRQKCLYIRKSIQIIMTDYTNIHIYNFENYK